MHRNLDFKSNTQKLITISVLSVWFIGIFSSCTISTPATETPLPEQQNIEKAFFVDPKGKPKTFLCSWAAESEVGSFAVQAAIHNVPLANHCNLEFEIKENALIGKRINPSFPNDSNRWAQIISIPIDKHYYYEKSKDDNGRDKNAFIENDQRSHWSARPFMKLDLKKIQILDWAYVIRGSDKLQVTAIEDIEWDSKNNFLGFSVLVTDGYLGVENQTRYRFNFMEYKHNPNFKPTPFNDKNFSLMNVLHIVGEKADGIYPILRAAHWDLSKPHDIYLNDFPKEYVGIAADIVKDWNETLISAGALVREDVTAKKTGFRINEKKIKHAFDLRYSSITWVSDLKISLAPHAPLGIAIAQADVQNGEILWGGITLYGGFLERYIKSYASVASLPDSATTNSSLKNIAKNLFSKLNFESTPNLPSGVNLSGVGLLSNSNHKVLDATKKAYDPAEYDSILRNALQKKSREKQEELNANFKNETFQEYVSDKLFSLKLMKRKEVAPAVEVKGQSEEDRIRDIINAGAICADRTFEDVAPGWVQGIAESKREYDDVLRSMIKELIVHEFGHFLGLGHQFKENILPERGTVPDSIYDALAKRATAEAGFTQMTSVMGYRHPRSEMRTLYDDIKPGPQDRLVLAYLYTQRYSNFKTGDSDFTFIDIPKDGIIPQNDPNSNESRNSYFPQCNDYTASFSLDPYCNRFDRGHNATEIVGNYFADLNDNIEQSHFAFTDAKGSNPEASEVRLWVRNFETMGRIRIFYDYMRKKYRDDIDSIGQDESALYDFSSACKSGISKSSALVNMFNKHPELKELCQVNANVVEQIRNNLTKNLSDYTKMDESTAYMPAAETGGDIENDYSHAFGSWTQLSSAPLKIPAAYALMTAAPWVKSGDDLLSTVSTYRREDSGFSYSTLYPREFTTAIAYAVRDNLKFTNLNGHDEGNRLGRTILTLGGLASSVHNNENHIFARHYLETIQAQSQFSLNVVSIEVEAIGKASAPFKLVDRFRATARDVYGNATPISSFYLLPNRNVIVQANGMFLYPISKIEFLDDRRFFLMAYKMSYTHEFGDLLNSLSVKTQLQTLSDEVMSSCLKGTNENGTNGIVEFFKEGNPNFEGFSMQPNLISSEPIQVDFDRSVQAAFNQYYKLNNTNSQACDEAISGLGLIMSSAAIINGGWLPEARRYLLNTF